MCRRGCETPFATGWEWNMEVSSIQGQDKAMYEIRQGFYKDRYGRWQKDRRSGRDRRTSNRSFPVQHERRTMFRRKADRETIERDHREMIQDALDEFAEGHGGHL